MKIAKAKYIVNAVGCYVGKEADLAFIESKADSDLLLKNIIETGYYNTTYFEEKTGFVSNVLTMNLWFVASMIRKLKPRRTMEIGAGKGDVVKILRTYGIDAYGIDFSKDMYEQLDPSIRDSYFFGDASEVCQQLIADEKKFDTVLALDIWEHFSPNLLDNYIASSVNTLTEDGFIFTIIPAFGSDEVFGEQFPLEFEENREEFNSGRPFKYITLEKLNPPIPASGHLTWAPVSWWENKFLARGLKREKDLEKCLHKIFDQFIPHSNKTFFIFRRDTDQAAARKLSIQKELAAASFNLQKYRDLAELFNVTYLKKQLSWGVSPYSYIADRSFLFARLFPIVRMIKKLVK